MENQEIAEGHKNVVVRDKAGRFDVGTNLRYARTTSADSQKRLLQAFQTTFEANGDGQKALVKLLHTSPSRFFDIWIRMIGNNVSQPTEKQDVTASNGLLNALQTGRLAEQLAAMVKSGRAMQEFESRQVVTEPAQVVGAEEVREKPPVGSGPSEG